MVDAIAFGSAQRGLRISALIHAQTCNSLPNAELGADGAMP
jgi:hypothetical protein